LRKKVSSEGRESVLLLQGKRRKRSKGEKERRRKEEEEETTGFVLNGFETEKLLTIERYAVLIGSNGKNNLGQ